MYETLFYPKTKTVFYKTGLYLADMVSAIISSLKIVYIIGIGCDKK